MNKQNHPLDLTFDDFHELGENRNALDPVFFLAGRGILYDYTPPKGAFVTAETAAVALHHYLVTRVHFDYEFSRLLADLQERVIVAATRIEAQAVRAAITEAGRAMKKYNKRTKGRLRVSFKPEQIRRLLDKAVVLDAADEKQKLTKVIRVRDKVMLVAANGVYVEGKNLRGNIDSLPGMVPIADINIERLAGVLSEDPQSVDVHFIDGALHAISSARDGMGTVTQLN